MKVARLTNLESWEDIASRGTAYLQRNVDYRCWHDELRQAARTAAAKMGYRVQITWHNQEEEILKLVFTKMKEVPETRKEFWDRVLDGKTWRIAQDIDFTESISLFRKKAHAAAKQRGKRAVLNVSETEIEIHAVRIT
jgi:uncharacterized protein YlaN (UPF0358 family)